MKIKKFDQNIKTFAININDFISRTTNVLQAAATCS